MRFLSVCSGIEAASVAWEPLGWKAHAFAEIEAFPRAVLAHHYPETPNLGDMSKFAEWPNADVDLLVGGTPCQSFSVAGLRKGMADPRGNLALTFLAIAAKYAPRWILWENVPGVLSSEQGRDFGAFLGGLGQCGYGWAYRVLDAQHFGVPQRRRRVFVVGYLGDWRRAAAVLFERHSLSGDTPPRREKGEGAAALTANGVGTCGADDNQGQAGHLIGYCGEVSRSLTACKTATGRLDPNEQEFVATAYQTSGNCGAWPTGDITGALDTNTDPNSHVLCFTTKDHGADASDISPTLRSGSHSGSHANGGVMPAVAFMENQQGAVWEADSVQALNKGGGKPGQGYAAIRTASAVRRLTPEECEKLQGFSPGYTAVSYRGKPAADGPRYKSLGNSMAVPVMAWIGRRIQQVDSIPQSDQTRPAPAQAGHTQSSPANDAPAHVRKAS